MSSTADIVGDVGTGVASLLMAAQLPLMYVVVFKTKSVAQISVWPTIGQFANFISWVVYALLKSDRSILQVNVIGVAFSILYGTIFLIYARGRNWWLLVGTLAATLAVLGGIFAAIVVPGALSKDAKINALGYVAVLANTIMYASPLAAIRVALKSMDPHAMPLLLTAASTGCSCCWLVYGLLTSNVFVWGPNVAGVALSLLQIALTIYITLRVRADPTLTKRLAEEQHHEEEHHELTAGHEDEQHHDHHEVIDVGGAAAEAARRPPPAIGATREPARRAGAAARADGSTTPYTPLATADSLRH